MTNKTDGTGQGLVEFLDYLAEKGLANKSTMQTRRSAVTKVLGIDEGWKTIDLRTLDVDEQAERFERLNAGGDYTPNSLATYSSRFKSAVSDYLTYLQDPARFKPTVSTPRAKRGTRQQNGADASSVSSDHGNPSSSSNAGSGHPPPPRRDNLMTYPYPLRDSTDVYLQLPRDLRPGEAERLAKFIASLATASDSDREPDASEASSSTSSS